MLIKATDGRVATAATWAKGEPCLIREKATKENYEKKKLLDRDRPSHGRR
jgi:hypothetical protein